MKPTRFALAWLALVALPLAEAAPAGVPETWISPQVQAIRDRVHAAYAAIEAWTATIVSEQVAFKNGVDNPLVFQTTERYLKSGGPVGYYANTGGDAKRQVLVRVMGQDLAVQRVVYRNDEKLNGWISPSAEANRPEFWNLFESLVGHTSYARWVGRESVAGHSCDIVELTDLERRDPDDPKAVTGVASTRFYVNPAGLIERITTAADSKSGTRTEYADMRITYDAQAKLTPADFSRESFERDAVIVLQGRPMPELKEQLFAAGGSLPDLTFSGWADGKPFRISDLKGKIVVLETWASWCYFCKEAFPFYEKTRQAIADQDVIFVAVSFDQKLADYEKWMKRHAASYGFKFGRVDAEDPAKAMKEFRGSLPAFYVLGRDGKILSSYIGFGYGKGEDDPRLLAALRAAGIKI